MPLTEDQLRRLFPSASEDFARRNLHPRTTTVVESDRGHGALAEGQAKDRDSARFLVVVTSHRHRLLDEDNLCEKYHVDSCRYAGLIPDDAPDKTKIQVSQVKIGKDQEERVVIQIYRL